MHKILVRSWEVNNITLPATQQQNFTSSSTYIIEHQHQHQHQQLSQHCHCVFKLGKYCCSLCLLAEQSLFIQCFLSIKHSLAHRHSHTQREIERYNFNKIHKSNGWLFSSLPSMLPSLPLRLLLPLPLSLVHCIHPTKFQIWLIRCNAILESLMQSTRMWKYVFIRWFVCCAWIKMEPVTLQINT